MRSIKNILQFPRYSLIHLKRNVLFICFALFATQLFAQTQKDVEVKVSFKQQSVQQIINQVEDRLNIKFNYSAETVSNDKYSFSAEGNTIEIVERVCSIIQRKCMFLESDVVVIELNPLISQTPLSRITGQVFDDQGNNVPFAYLTIPTLGIKEISDINGKFEIALYTTSSDTLIVEHLGFEDYIVQAGQLLDQKELYKVILRNEDHILNEIVITGKDQITSSQIEVLETSEDYVPSSSIDKDVLQLAQSASGVYLPSESISDLLIRGGSPDHIQFKWNGIQVFQNSHFYGKLSSINPFVVDKVKITKNGYSSDNSGQISGSINFSNDNSVKKNEVFAHLNLLYANVGTNMSFLENKLQVKLSTRRSHPDNWPTPIYSNYVDQIFQFGKLPDQDYFIELFEVDQFIIRESDVDFDDTNLSAKIELSDQHEVSANFLSINNNFDRTAFNTFSDTTELDRLQQSNVGWNLSSKHRWNHQWSTDVSYSKSSYEYNYSSFEDNRNINSINRTQQNELSQSQFRVDQSYINKWFVAKIGFQKDIWDSFVFDTDLSIPDMEPYTMLESKGEENSIYGNVSLSPSDEIKIDAGMRWSYFNRSLNDRVFKEPRIHISLLASDDLKFHIHYGKFHQQLNRRNFFTPLQADNGFWYMSNEKSNSNFIFTIESVQASIGAVLSKGPFHFGMNVYEKDIFNIWTSVLDFSIEENPYRFANIGINGIELEGKYRVKNYSSTITYDYINEKIFIHDSDLIIKSPFSQPHRFSVVQALNYKELSLSAQWRYATGRPYSVPTSISTNVNDDGENYYVVNFPELLSDHVDDYHSLDFGINYGFTFGKNNQNILNIGIQITNAYNKKNILKNQYFIDYKTDPVRLGLLEKSGLPTTYNFSIDYRY